MNLNVGSIIAALRLDDSQFTGVLGSTMKRFKSTISSVTATVTRSLKRATLAITAYAVTSLKAFASFEDAMVRSAVVTEGATGRMRKAMDETALQMSTVSILSARELAEGYFALGQAGFNAARSIKALPVVADFAIASQVKLDTATRYLVRTLEGLGMASENPIKNMQQMERVSNVFTYAAIKTTAEIEDFAVAMTHAAAPALKLVNKSMEEGTSVLMAFAQAGIVAEEAGTLLWTTIRDLQNANIRARDEWKKLGLAVYDTNGKMRNLADIFGDIEKKFGGMSDETKKASLQMLKFQDRSLRGIQALMGFSPAMKKFQKDMETNKKLSHEIAQAYQKTFKGAMIMLWNQIVRISIVIGSRLAPSILELAKAFKDNQEVIKSWAVAIADRFVFVGNVIRDYIILIKNAQNPQEYHAILMVFVNAATMVGKVLINIAARTGKGMAAALKAAILGDDLGKDELFRRANEVYKELGGKMRKLTEEELSKAGIFKPVLTRADEDLWKKSMDRVVAEHEGRFVAGFASGLKEEIQGYLTTFTESVASMEMGPVKDIMKKNLAELEFKDKMREWSDSWQEFKKNGLEPVVDVVSQLKDNFLVMIGLKDQLKEGLLPALARADLPPMVAAKKTIEEMLRDLTLESNRFNLTLVERNKLAAMDPLRKILESTDMYGEAVTRTAEEQEKYNAYMGEMALWLDIIRKQQRSSIAFFDQMDTWIDSATNMWQNFGEVAIRAMDGLADTIATNLEQGTADWKAFGAAVLQELNRIIIKMMLAEALSSALGALGFGEDKGSGLPAAIEAAGLSASASITTAGTTMATAITTAGYTAAAAISAAATGSAISSFFGSGPGAGGGGAAPGGFGTGGGTTVGVALGGIFNRGNIMAFAKGGILNQPTLAPMALMGEAGPEAVMPLSRSASGELGVKATQPNINFNPQMKLIVVRDDREAALEAMRSPAGEKIIIQKAIRNKRTLG